MEFINDAAVWMLGFLVALYLVQIFIAINKASKPMEVKGAENSKFRLTLFNCLNSFDDGLRNIWAFFILALVLPVVLTSLVNVIPIVASALQTYNTETQEIKRAVLDVIEWAIRREQGTTTQTESVFIIESGPESLNIIKEKIDLYRTWSESGIESIGNNQPGSHLLYYVCLACVSVLITLEFSYLHTLRISASEWIPMLLAALVIDFMALLTLNFVVGNPNLWPAVLDSQSSSHNVVYHPTFLTNISITIATIFAICSSLSILVLARAAGGLHDGKIEVSAVNGAEKIEEND